MSNGLNIYGDGYDQIPVTTQLTHALMKLALNLKGGNVLLNVPPAIELYDAFHFKILLLDININNSNRLMVEIHNKKLNELLESIHQYTFHQRTIQQLMSLISEARKLPASTYTTPYEAIFDKDQITGDDKELDDIDDNNKELHKVLLQYALDMKKMFPIRWTNEVIIKFVAIRIQTPQALLHHIAHGKLNQLLSQHGYLTMNYFTLRILTGTSPCFRT